MISLIRRCLPCFCCFDQIHRKELLIYTLQTHSLFLKAYKCLHTLNYNNTCLTSDSQIKFQCNFECDINDSAVNCLLNRYDLKGNLQLNHCYLTNLTLRCRIVVVFRFISLYDMHVWFL